MKTELKPILKWVGGKRQLLPIINEMKPKKFNNYIEPFLGGGAVLFDLQPKIAFVNDFNSELINLYQTIKVQPLDLINQLKIFKEQNDEENFYLIRNIDRNKKEFENKSNVWKAARTIYLNKTAFNGVYRVNSKNEFNVPFGKYTNPNICDENLINNLSKYFNDNQIEFFNGDFEIIKNKIKKGDFVFLDPPYDPLTKTSSFTSYTKDGFGDAEQIRVKELCDYINQKGAYFMLTNHPTDFIINLYQNYHQKIVDVKRNINCKGDKRKGQEIVITNY